MKASKLQDSSSFWDASYISHLLASAFAPDLASTPSTSAPSATIDAIITFDEQGVSSHPNHISCYHGVSAFVKQLMSRHSGWECPISVYSLKSVGVLRKYSGVIDAAVTVVRSILGIMLRKDKEKRGLEIGGNAHRGEISRDKSDREKEMPSWMLFVSGISNWNRAQRAMVGCHKSQMVWFRWGWVTIGRYMVVNDLQKIALS